MAVFDVNAIANFFIKKANEERANDLTPMKLLKLVYIAHGWSLGLLGKPLFNEEVEAWKFGPVIPALYHSVKAFGKSQVDRELMTHPFMADDCKEIKKDSIEDVLLNKVWEAYGHLSGVQLSSITHKPGSPWEKTWDNKALRGLIIPTTAIQEHYESLAQRGSSSSSKAAG